MDKEIFEFIIENEVTDVGLRLDIAGRVPDELDIRIDNLSAHKVKVYLRGKEEGVERFYRHLKRQKKLGDAKNYTVSELKPVEAGCISVNTDRFFHKLQCEQMGKFVEVGKDLGEKIDNGFENMSKKLDELPKNLAKELNKIFSK